MSYLLQKFKRPFINFITQRPFFSQKASVKVLFSDTWLKDFLLTAGNL